MDVKKFLSQLQKDTHTEPKPVSDKDKMNIINSWLKKQTKQVKEFLFPKGKPPRTPINYLGHMFAKAGIPKDVAYKYVKDKYYKPDMDEYAFTKEFEDEYDTTASNSEWIQRVFNKKK